MRNPFQGRSLSIIIATLGPVGYIPKAPGTFGTLAAIPLFFLFSKTNIYLQLILILFLIIISVWASSRAGELFQNLDDPRIVIDELVGYLVATFGISFNIWSVLFSFVIFRFFDVLKIYPISLIDSRWRTGVGVVADDIIAGVFTNIIMHLALWIM